MADKIVTKRVLLVKWMKLVGGIATENEMDLIRGTALGEYAMHDY